MARRTLKGLRGIVTGASSGIGWALALELAKRGSRLVITARRGDRLAELADGIRGLGGEAHIVAGDVTDPGVRESALAAATSHFGGLDFLVNNAGMSRLGPFAEADSDRLRLIFEVNFFSAVELIRGALPLLRKGRTPIIVNVSSVLGHRAVPGRCEYCASKFALHGFSDALRAELRPEHIDVLLVSPSITDTEFFDVANTSSGRPTVARRGMPSKKVAIATARAMAAGRSEIILSLGGKMLVWLDRLSPTLANWAVAKFTPP